MNSLEGNELLVESTGGLQMGTLEARKGAFSPKVTSMHLEIVQPFSSLCLYIQIPGRGVRLV